LERTTVSTYRFILAFVGGLCVQLFTNPLVKFFGGTKTVEQNGVLEEIAADPQTGFFWTVFCYAIAAAILFTITFLSTRERVQPEQTTNTKFSADVADLLKNRPWIVLLFVGLFQILAGWTRGSATGYYFNYFAEIKGRYLLDLGSWGQYFDIGDFGFFFFVGSIFAIMGMFLTRPIVKIFGNKWLMILMMLGNAVCMGLVFFLRQEHWPIVYALHCLGSFITGPMPILLWAMYADAADYSEWVHHRRATGLVFAAATFSQKLGSALGAAVPGWLLGASGFVAPIDNVPQPQSEGTIDGIISMMSIIPAAFFIAGCVAMLFYNLNDRFLQQIEQDLLERKRSNGSDSTAVTSHD
jgi:GPH family glycoside/pentoside/hexuronide:cation symporter